MSDRIPFDIQIEIIKKLPVKSLIRFRSVSKQWKSLIGSSEFNDDYTGRHHLFVTHPGVPNERTSHVTNHKRVCVSIIDGDTFPKEKNSLPVPESVKLFTSLRVAGGTHGLFCLSGQFSSKAVVWNPSIRKSVAIDIPGSYNYSPVIGFGVCPNTCDPKIVKISIDRFSYEKEANNNWHVEVYTLSPRVWRTPFNNRPSKFLDNILYDEVVNIDGFIYWLVDDLYKRMIMSFNLTSEEFKIVYLPDKLALLPMYDYEKILMFKLGGSLALTDPNQHVWNTCFKVWIMDSGVSKTFTNLYTINLPYEKYFRVVGYRKNGQCIMELIDDYEDTTELKVYKPCSTHITDIDIYGLTYPVIVSSYTESLLLLEYKENMIH